MTSTIYWILGLFIIWMLFSDSVEAMASSPGVFDQLSSTSPYFVPTTVWGQGYYRNPGYGSDYPRATGWTW